MIHTDKINGTVTDGGAHMILHVHPRSYIVSVTTKNIHQCKLKGYIFMISNQLQCRNSTDNSLLECVSLTHQQHSCRYPSHTWISQLKLMKLNMPHLKKENHFFTKLLMGQ